MPTIKRGKATLRPTVHAKRIKTESMYNKGRAFIGAGLLLRQHASDEGMEYVYLHLLCQGVEIVHKAILLTLDYDRFNPALKDKPFGHDLVHVVNTVAQEKGPDIAKDVLKELQGLNEFYRYHHLRYGSLGDIFIDPRTIPRDAVLRYMYDLMKACEGPGGVFERQVVAPAQNMSSRLWMRLRSTLRRLVCRKL